MVLFVVAVLSDVVRTGTSECFGGELEDERKRPIVSTFTGRFEGLTRGCDWSFLLRSQECMRPNKRQQ